MKKSILIPIMMFIMVMFHSVALAQFGPTYDYETIASGTWSSGSTWKDGSIPMIGNAKNILIKHAVTASGLNNDDYISCALLTIETGASLTMTNTGRISLGGGGNGGSIQCNGTGALNVSSGTVTIWENSGAINGGYSGSTTVQNIVIEGTNVELPYVTITGTLTIKNAGSIAATSGYPQYGSSSTLVYDCGVATGNEGDPIKVVGKEWKTAADTGAGIPKNVTLTGSKIILGAGNDYNQMSGNLNIDAGSTLILANEIRIRGNFTKTEYGTFTHNDKQVTFNGSVDQSITLLPTSSSVEFYHVTVDKSSGKLNLATSAQMTVKGNLTMTKGNIAVGDYAVFLVDDGIIQSAGPASFFTGRLSMRRTFGSSFTMVFPVGGGTSYRPVTLSLDAINNPQYSVTLVNSAPTGTPDGTTILALSKRRYWILNYDGGTISTEISAKVRIKLLYGADDGVIDQTNLKIAAGIPMGMPPTYSSIGPTQEGPFPLSLTPGELTSDEFTYTQSSMPPSTCNIAFGDAGVSNPLPVELSSFTASAATNGVTLNWNTATETNNYGFDVERCAVNDRHLQGDGHLAWIKIGFVEGNGSTNAPKSYSFTDNSASGKTSYRLKQIDRDGKFEYSQTVEVIAAVTPKEFGMEQNYPNPFNPTTSINYQLSANSFTTLKIYDAIGREVATLVNEVKEAGSHSVQFNGARLSSGIYFAKLTSNSKTQIRKLLLMK